MTSLATLLARTTRVGSCRLWTGPRNREDGFPTTTHAGRTVGVHRLVCELQHGRQPSFIEACHSPACEALPGMYVGGRWHPKPGRLCVEPTHLTPGTRSDNARHRERAKRRRTS